MVTELSPMPGMVRDLDSLMDAFFAPLSYSQRRATFPPMNISEDENNLYVECEMPGVSMGDVEITLVNHSLSITGERKAREGKHFRQERPMGNFQRVISLGTAINRDKVKATLKDGILSVTLPKAEETKPRKIDIAG